MPEQPEEEPQRYDIPLGDLTGEHKYALAPDEENDTPPEPGAPVAYVAEPAKAQPNTMTVEGAIVGIGNMAAGAAKEGGTPAWTLRALLFAFALPAVVILVGRLAEWF
ncbi:MAG TPA: hypothetical protein VNQ77_14325 [Frankiaceae bacterium]|nr:hypothetical protein [Frankiaceae bacterium]